MPYDHPKSSGTNHESRDRPSDAHKTTTTSNADATEIVDDTDGIPQLELLHREWLQHAPGPFGEHEATEALTVL